MIAATIAATWRRRASLTVGAIALAGLSGCSFAFVEGPPTDHASRHFFDCTSSMLAPGLDAALTATLALGVLGETSDGSRDAQSIVESSALVVGALASATYGYLQVSHCRQAKDALAERLLDMPYLGVPPVSGPPHVGGTPERSPRAPTEPPTGPIPGDRTHAPASRDPWLSEGPPPESPRAPPLIPPPYLRLAPQAPPPPRPPGLVAPTATPAPEPVPTPGSPADAGSPQ